MANRRVAATNEEMLALRKQGLTFMEIAEKLGISRSTVQRRLGKHPESLNRMEALKVAAIKAATEPQKAPSEPLEAEVAVEVKEELKTPQRRQKIETERFFDFAVIKDWSLHLQRLAALAKPEPWRFTNPEKACKFPETQILENYILTVFKIRAEEYNTNLTENPDKIFYIRNNCCCFHTGLYTSAYMDIYAYFIRNVYEARDGVKWYLQGFRVNTDTDMRYVFPTPENRTLSSTDLPLFNPFKEIRINIPHILEREKSANRLPEAVTQYWDAPLLLETAVERARRMACAAPETVVARVRMGIITYLLPLYMTNPNTPDVAAILTPISGGYNCVTVLTLNQAYMTARINGRPTAEWLTAQLEHGGGEPRGVITDERRRLHTNT